MFTADSNNKLIVDFLKLLINRLKSVKDIKLLTV